MKSTERDTLKQQLASLPVRGAWVEINKFLHPVPVAGKVAPRAGSVG